MLAEPGCAMTGRGELPAEGEGTMLASSRSRSSSLFHSHTQCLSLLAECPLLSSLLSFAFILQFILRLPLCGTYHLLTCIQTATVSLPPAAVPHDHRHHQWKGTEGWAETSPVQWPGDLFTLMTYFMSDKISGFGWFRWNLHCYTLE